MSEKREKRATEMRTPEFRVSYPNVFKPKLNELSETPKYEYLVDGIFDKNTTDLNPFKKIINAAIIEKWGSKKDAPKNLLYPIKDGDEMENPDYAGKWIMSFKASENYKPNVISTRKDANGKFIPIVAERDFYGGCYAHVMTNAYGWDFKHKKSGAVIKAGVSFNLGNIQKLRDGEKFGGGFSAPEDDFEGFENDDDSSSAEGEDDVFNF